MTMHATLTISPTGNEPPPVATTAWAPGNVPWLLFTEDQMFVCLNLGNHDDPAAYLDGLAAAASDLAARVRAGRVAS